MDNGKEKKGPYQKPGHTRGCQGMPNISIPETENIKWVWTHEEKRRTRTRTRIFI